MPTTRTRQKPAATNRAKSKDDDAYLKKYGDKLSDSTRRAKWISSTEEHADRKGQSLATRNHDVIRAWAEERNAVPATVDSARSNGDIRVLRFDFPGYGGQSLRKVEWDGWFRTFDDRNLVFVFQEHLRNGNRSNFFRFDNPEQEDA
jgi:hypothetical protein